jgi:RHH-type proline utilization regulon transcriptional repressor/proline dehydrogenase/delta 1-pyrroline-5-carboxylate dehydrogenase
VEVRVAVNEQRVREIGQDLFARMKGETPGLFDKAWWSGQVLEWAMRDPVFKTEMFRFVDVFPVLTTPEDVARHIQEYLLRPGVNPPTVIKVALKGAGLGSFATKIAAGQIAKNLEGMATRFIVGTNAATALETLASLRGQKQAFTVDLLGEATVSDTESSAYAARYMDLLDGLAAPTSGWKPDPVLDTDDRGAIPRLNVSVKVSALDCRLDPLAFDASVEAASARLLPLFKRAKALGAFINLDMEQRALKELTYAIFFRVMEDPSLEGWSDAGVVVQAYLRDADRDVELLLKWAKRRQRRITVRLVKGAYWDYETVRAAQEGWPSPVWLDKGDADATYEALAEELLSNHKLLRTALGSHNVRSLAHGMAAAEKYGVPPNGFEVQCLYGMAEPIKAACVRRGHRVRVYAPIGELLPGMAYLVRRLLENTSNQSWLRMGFVDGASHDALLAAPKRVGRSPLLGPVPAEVSKVESLAPFVNEPLRDFGEATQRAAFAEALDALRGKLGRTVEPVVDGRAVTAGRPLERVDPSDGKSVVAVVRLASTDDADRAVAAAHAFFPTWRDTPVHERAQRVLDVAGRMRKHRDALSAVMVREVGKPWREADADVCEAIDFCEYYAREALRLDAGQHVIEPPGETNQLGYLPRGVTAVIAPWNFPLAILTGMTMAALVTGNPVVMKPAEQSSLIAARFFELCREAKVPAGALHFLPGLGEEVGARLVADPRVVNIAFTGSVEVGLSIWRQAGLTLPGQTSLKRVVCEMGGKNAIIVDADADLDEAVVGTVHSAFGFAGQKCSACSRVIVLRGQHDAFVQRLVEATKSLVVGPASGPRTRVPPVVDAASRDRLMAAIGAAEARCKRHTTLDVPPGGFYVPPTIFTGVDPKDPLAQDELFGPVLAVLEASSFDEALDLANGTRFALTGGLYSRSPGSIERARREFRVGNLYINRPITGALVGRHPFGGFHLSGGGTKAGGPDYLRSFVDPRHISENTMRRGFTPSE